MKSSDSQGGMRGFGADDPAVPMRGANHAKHRGRKGKRHGGHGAKLRRGRH